MSLISKSIENIFNGISQQPAPARHPTQGELQENAYSTIALGLRKRPPTKHLAKLRAALASNNAFVHIINRDSANRFALIIQSGTLEVYRLSDGASMTVSAPSGLTYLTSADPRSDFSAVTVADYTFIVNRTTVAAMGVATTGGTLTGTVQLFSNLPASPAVGNIYCIQGDSTNQFSAYYVEWNGSVWVETTKPGETYQFDATTMPHKLVHTGGTAFTFDAAAWDDRLVGDLTVIPQPSFVGYAIKDVFYYRGRLGMCANESVILSRANEPFTFWRKSATALLDDDPIDVSTTSTEVALLYWAVPYDKALFLFSDQQQFQLTGGDILSPKTVKIDPVTNFESSLGARPLSLGAEMYFPVDRGTHSTLREYYVQLDTVSNDAADITAHVPAYVPSAIFRIAGSTAEDLICAISPNDPSTIYGYKFYWDGTTKVQSSWSKLFVLDATDTVLGFDFIANTLYVVVSRADGVYLEYADFTAKIADTGLSFEVLLDRRQELTGVYDSPTDTTTWTLGFNDDGNFSVVLGTAFTNEVAYQLTTTRPTSGTVAATGDWSAGSCFVGRNYTMKYRFSEQYLQDPRTHAAILTGKTKMRYMIVAYQDSAYFQVKVTPRARNTYTYTFTNRIIGDSGFTLSAPGVLSGTYRFQVGASNIGTVIEIQNPSYMPSNILSAEWVAVYTKLANPQG